MQKKLVPHDTHASIKPTRSVRRFGILVVAALLVVVLSSLFLVACDNQTEAYGAESSSAQDASADSASDVTVADLQGARVAVLDGSVQEQLLRDAFPESEVNLFKSSVDAIAAVAAGKADISAAPTSVAVELVRSYENLSISSETLATIPVGFAFPKGSENNTIFKQLNEFIAKITEDGTIDALKEKWQGTDDAAKVLEINVSDLPATNGTITVATRADNPPFEYLEGNSFAGYDIEITVLFCKEYGYAVNFDALEFSSIILAVSENKCDFAAANLSITEERKESVDFSDPINEGNYSLVYNTDYAATGKSSSNVTGTSSIAQSFEKTFITDNRWQLILSGLGVTLLVTLGAAILGTALAFALVLARRRGGKKTNTVIDLYVRLFQGTPVLVMLLIFYYIVFGSVEISSVIVAVIVFGLNSAAFISETLHSCIVGVDPGQREAALASGFSEKQAFIHFILPLAIQQALPMYRGELISLLKGTSIVGYIALIDLTKAGDVIRSRTYEALFPLLTVAAIYLLMAWIVSILLKKVEQALSIKPKTQIKGVVMK